MRSTNRLMDNRPMCERLYNEHTLNHFLKCFMQPERAKRASESRSDFRKKEKDSPSRLMPTAMHFFRRQYWQRLRFTRWIMHCWFLVHGRYWIFCWMERRKKPCKWKEERGISWDQQLMARWADVERKSPAATQISLFILRLKFFFFISFRGPFAQQCKECEVIS